MSAIPFYPLLAVREPRYLCSENRIAISNITISEKKAFMPVQLILIL
jgi:hypothetical protein